MLSCKKCLFHDFEETVCMKGYDVPEEGEKCNFFTESIAKDLAIYCSLGDKQEYS